MPMRPSRRTFAAASAAALAPSVLLRFPANAAQFEFKCATGFPAEHPFNVRLSQMWASVEAESGGRIHTQLFPNSQLGSDSAMFSQLRQGAIAFFLIPPGNMAAVVPVADIGNLGFAFKDQDAGIRVMNGPLGAYVRAQAAAKDLHLLGHIWNSGMLQIGSSAHPIRTPDDLRGYKIRVPESRIFVELFKALGASAVPLTIGEVYTALQTKIVDGEGAPLTTINAMKWYEVNKYMSLVSFAWSGNWLIANADAWKSLPPDLQALVERNNTKYSALEAQDSKALNAGMAENMAREGVIVNQVDQAPFRQRLGSYYQSWAATFGPTAWQLLESGIGQNLG